ncbi:hypothetical protein SCHPADRAFT_801356, partial [Schizopora paradoxa]
SFKLDLPSNMKQRGIHPSFHASLLRIHVPNDDRRFPGRDPHQVLALGDTTESEEWPVEKIIDHAGKGATASFLVQWKSGDTTWLPYAEIKHLSALPAYFDALGVESIAKL